MIKNNLTQAEKDLVRQALSLQADLMLGRKQKIGNIRIRKILAQLGFTEKEIDTAYFS